MRPRWTITLTTQQRVSLGMGAENAFLTRSHPYIPGSVVRGALAAAWLREGIDRDLGFEMIFETGRFSNAWPEGVEVQSQSVLRTKYGTNTSDDDRDLAFTTNANSTDHAPKPSEEALKGGFDYSRGFGQLRRRTVTATAMKPRKHVALDRALYRREALEKGTVFTGTLILPEGAELPEEFTKINTIYVGGRASVMGRTTLEIQRSDPPRIPTSNEVVIRTLSHSILVDDFGVPMTSFSEALEARGVSVIKNCCWADRVESGVAGGWHAASGLPKPMEIGLSPGATARIERPKKDDVLEKLLDEGIGLRRAEGYGWIEIVDRAYQRPTHPEAVSTIERSSSKHAMSNDEMEIEQILHDLQALKLTPQQEQWLARMLRLRAKGESPSKEERNQPAVNRLAPPQSKGIMKIILETRNDLRQSLAHAITRGGTQ